MDCGRDATTPRHVSTADRLRAGPGELCPGGLRHRALAADDGIVTLLPRSSLLLAGLRPATRRRLSLALGASATLAVTLLFAAEPAGAVVKAIEIAPSKTTEVGLEPRESTAVFEGTPTVESFANNEGHAVLHGTHTYAIYWDPTDHYHGDWQHLIDTFLQGVGAESGALSNVFSVDSQYTDKSNTGASYQAAFMGAYTDTTAYPVSGNCTDPAPLEPKYRIGPGHTEVCLTDKQLQEELASFIAHNGLAKGMGTIFYVLTPPAVTVCVDKAATHCSDYSGSVGGASYKASFCGYHSAVNPDAATNGDGNTIVYAVIPWTAGGLGDFGLPQTAAYDCQDGGFDPSTKPAEEPETVRHQQEPNQPSGVGPDGYPDTGLADLIINQIAVAQQNTVTDPLMNAWKDSASNEATDECRNFFATTKLGGASGAHELTGAGTLSNQTINGANYYLNDAFNMAALRLPYPGVPCVPGSSLVPTFTTPSAVNAHEIVSFDGMESNITLNATSYFPQGGGVTTTYATYTWIIRGPNGEVEEFSGYAPGAPACATPWLSPCAASELHAFEYGGQYTVTLKVKDVGGNEASSVPQPISVGGPLRPAATNQSVTTASTSSSASSTPTATPAASLPTPVATAAVLTRSLKSALAGGLVVRYSVNEQVAGHFEVLLASSLAHRIGLHGPAATGLAKGTPPQIVIARALLVTTTGGRNTVKIVFGKYTASRLRRLGNVSLMIRLVVRNASPQNPASATVLSVVKLAA
jgi:hypothetical protein